MATNEPEVGTIVSEGTLRTTDLIDAFLTFLRELDPERARKLVALYEVDEDDIESWADTNLEDALWLLADLVDVLDTHAPDGAYFGAHPGDGACFGYWPEDDAGEESKEV